jgi:hypothetical protein
MNSRFGQQQFNRVSAFGFGRFDIWLEFFHCKGVPKYFQSLGLQLRMQNDFTTQFVSGDLKLKLCVSCPNALSNQWAARVVRDTKKINLPISLRVDPDTGFDRTVIEFKNLIQPDFKHCFGGETYSKQEDEYDPKKFHDQSLNLEPVWGVNLL